MGTPEQRAIRRATPEAYAKSESAEGSMGLEVIAADTFIEHTGRVAAIGSITETSALLRS